jgi:hypothetical protein
VVIAALLATALRTTTPLLWTAVLIAEFASATIRVRATPVFAGDAAGKKHERETNEDPFGRFHLKTSCF